MVLNPAQLQLAFSDVTKKLLWNPHLKAIRNGLTLTLPLVMAGCLAVLLANFPVTEYQHFMTNLFGEDWRAFCVNISNGTFAILSLIIMLTVSYSIAEHNNSLSYTREMHPAVNALVSLGCLMILIEPYPLLAAGTHPPPGQGLPIFWLGIHGLFLAIIVAFVSTTIFYHLRRVSWLRISFYSEEADPSISYAFSAMLPGMITILVFALVRTVTSHFGIESLNQTIYDLLSAPFARMGNTFATAIFYTFIRHFFWFFGIHGTNLMEPVTTSIYVPAMEENMAAVAEGLAAPNIFTKTFFDAFLAMGGSGATICLILALFLFNRRGSMFKIAQISLLPAIFNINEMIMFGLPIVLNAVFLIPFITVPLVQCVISYVAMVSGLVPYTINMIDWTAPPFISGYAATGSYMGAMLQLVNLAVGVMIYLPFVRIAEAVKKEAFNKAFKELMPGYAESIGNSDYVITGEAKALSRSLAKDLAEAIERNEISLEYQPQVESTTGKVFGVEALMRWDHSHLGRIPPGLFIALAEESGLIKKLGSWALEEACWQWDQWRQAGVDVVMSVNLSIHQLDDDAILDEIHDRVARYAIPRGMLEVEVTESTALGGGNRAAMLHRIHDLGVNLAIDDFGMGHSSLVYLKQFPVDTIKIDRVLSKDVVTSRHSSEIIFTIAELCRSLNIHCLVEFVDNVEQLKVLQGLGCTRIQGWLYSPSLPAAKCMQFIRDGAKIY
ncbi:MAG: EAL domain-containing protein [Planctomycetaceae bacterium]|nr:EAL domain-containing protein [Planctomycetaceae bacterium]